MLFSLETKKKDAEKVFKWAEQGGINRPFSPRGGLIGL